MRIMPTDIQGRECWLGTRKFFRRYGLDLRAFITGGIEAEKLEATGDAMALAVVERVRAARG